MPAWSWWLIFGGIAVLGAVTFALLGLRLWRKTRALFGDIQRLSAVAESFGSALAAGSNHPAPTAVFEPGGPPIAGRHRARP